MRRHFARIERDGPDRAEDLEALLTELIDEGDVFWQDAIADLADDPPPGFIAAIRPFIYELRESWLEAEWLKREQARIDDAQIDARDD